MVSLVDGDVVKEQVGNGFEPEAVRFRSAESVSTCRYLTFSFSWARLIKACACRSIFASNSLIMSDDIDCPSLLADLLGYGLGVYTRLFFVLYTPLSKSCDHVPLACGCPSHREPTPADG